MVEYKVAGRPVELNKGEKSDGTDWTVTFKNGKTTSLANVLALIEPKPELTMKEDSTPNLMNTLMSSGKVNKPTGGASMNGMYYHIQGGTKYDVIHFDYDSNSEKPFGVVQVAGHHLPTNLLNSLGFRETRSWTAGVEVYIADGNLNPKYISEEEMAQLVDEWGKGVESYAKTMGDFYKDRGKTSGTIDEANTLAEIEKLGLDDTITTNMWDQDKIEAAGDKINYPNWFKKDHKIINYNSRVGRISFDHPAHPKRSDNWVNSFLKDEYRVDLSDQPRGMLQVREEKERKLTYDDFVSMVRADMNAGSASDEYVSDERVREDAKWKYNEYLQGASLDDLFLYEATKEEEDEFHKKLDKLVHGTFGKRKGELEALEKEKKSKFKKHGEMSGFDMRGINEAKATCCHRCGRVHVKGTPCKRPYLKGKKSCAVKEVQDLQEMYKKLEETKSAPEGHYFTKSGNLVKGRMTKDAEERGARKSDPKDKMRSKIPKVTQYAEAVKEYMKKHPKMKKSKMMEAIRSIISEHETDPALELMVGDYQTKHYHMCPGAKALYQDIESKGVDMDLAVRTAKLQDALFAIEEEALDKGATEVDLFAAETVASQIMDMARMMGLEEEHSYIQGHITKIKNALIK